MKSNSRRFVRIRYRYLNRIEECVGYSAIGTGDTGHVRCGGKGGLFGKTPALVGFDGPPFLDQQLTEYMLPLLKGHLTLGTESEI
jgi:hypothetical protein